MIVELRIGVSEGSLALCRPPAGQQRLVETSVIDI
jgi:hypothetical protein